MKKLLITAFEPFGGQVSNASYEVVKRISNTIQDMHVVKEIIPVVYQPELYEALLLKHQPDYFLLCGQASGRSFVEIEHVAINLKYAQLPDNDGIVNKGSSIIENGEVAYFATIPTIKIVEQLTQHPVRLSLSAGGYICNMAFYASLYYQKIHQLKAKIGFIHFPLYEGQSNEQVLPTLSLDEMVIILEKIILNL